MPGLVGADSQRSDVTGMGAGSTFDAPFFTAAALTALISWLTHAGQSYAAAIGYVPLPAAVQQLATATLARVAGPAGSLAG